MRIDVYGSPTEAALEQMRSKAQLLGNAPVIVHDLHSGFSRFTVDSCCELSVGRIGRLARDDGPRFR
jgi:hypothetical protein